MKYGRILIFALVIVMVVTVVSSLAHFRHTPNSGSTPTPTAQPTLTPIAGYVVYTDEANGFTISYPEDWEIIPDVPEAVLIACRDNSSCEDHFPNFSVGKRELSQAMSVQTIFEEEKANLATLEGYTPISEEDVFLDGMPAIKHVFTLVVNEATVKVMEVLLVKGATLWFMPSECAPGCWGYSRDYFDTIVGSFHLH